MKKGDLRPLFRVNSPNFSTSLSTIKLINSCLYASIFSKTSIFALWPFLSPDRSDEFPDILHPVFLHVPPDPLYDFHCGGRIVKVGGTHRNRRGSCQDKLQGILRRCDAAHADD